MNISQFLHQVSKIPVETRGVNFQKLVDRVIVLNDELKSLRPTPVPLSDIPFAQRVKIVRVAREARILVVIGMEFLDRWMSLSPRSVTDAVRMFDTQLNLIPQVSYFEDDDFI